MSRLVFRFVTALLCGLLMAGAAAARGDSSAVDAIAAGMARPGVLRGEFTQEKRIAGFRNALRSQGRFLVARKHGVVWTTLKPFPSEVVVTADRIFSRQRDGSRQVQLDARQQPALRSVNAVMFALVSGDVQALRSQFEVTATRQAQGWRLGLTPRSATLAKAFRSLSLRGDRYVREVEIVEANGDSTRIHFSGMSETPAVLNADEARHFE